MSNPARRRAATAADAPIESIVYVVDDEQTFGPFVVIEHTEAWGHIPPALVIRDEDRELAYLEPEAQIIEVAS